MFYLSSIKYKKDDGIYVTGYTDVRIFECIYVLMYVCYMITLYGNSILILITSSLKIKALSHKSINLSIHLYIDLNIHLIANLCLSLYCQRCYSETHPSTYQGLSPKLYLRWAEKSECIRRQSLKHSNYHLTLIVQTRITNHDCTVTQLVTVCPTESISVTVVYLTLYLRGNMKNIFIRCQWLWHKNKKS